MPTTPVSLLERLREPRNDAAWQSFFDLYAPVLLACARRYRLPDADQADLVQDVLVQVFVNLPRFERRADGSFRRWLRTITHNKRLERLRRRSPQPMGGAAELPLPEGPDAAEEFWSRDYPVQVVRQAFNLIRGDFTESTWQAAWKVLVEERPAGEVATELALSVGAVHAARFRVLARLRRELGEMLE